MKHTNGPWEICEHSWSDTSVSSGSKNICRMSIYDEATEETQAELEDEMNANARLIAAAPEMITIIRRAALALRVHPDYALNSEFGDLVSTMDEINARASA